MRNLIAAVLALALLLAGVIWLQKLGERRAVVEASGHLKANESTTGQLGKVDIAD